MKEGTTKGAPIAKTPKPTTPKPIKKEEQETKLVEFVDEYFNRYYRPVPVAS